jgi:hypothetical protein
MRETIISIAVLITAALSAVFPQTADAGLMTKFSGGSPSCISCHSLAAAGLEGGYLASDISGVLNDFGEEGLTDFLKDIPIEAMTTAYAANPLTDEDITQLINDFGELEEKQTAGTASVFSSHTAAGAALFVLFAALLRLALYRKRGGVK